jgi:hypothetical protein
MIVKLTYENLLRIKTILEEFGLMSGLVCNVEKTVLLPVGNPVIVDPRIADLGFTVVDKVTILGLVIDRNGYTQSNFEKIQAKINYNIQHWRPFNLSLPGRILIAKCMLYSQLNYLGCFITIPENYMATYDNMIVRFVSGNLNITKKRMYRSPEDGGLGLFVLNDFLDSQKCAWIKRSIGLDETWKIILYLYNYGNVFNSKSVNIDVREYPICHGICKSFEKVQEHFTAINENFQHCFIFENKKFTINLDSREYLKRSTFGIEFCMQYAGKLLRVKYLDIYDERDNMIPENAVVESTGINFTALQLFMIRGVCSTARIKFRKKELADCKGVDITTFFMRRKRGSSHIRKLLYSSILYETPHNIVKFASNLDIIITGEQSKFLNKLWTNSIFSSKDKTFFFKLHNNTLGFNNAVAHFVRGHSPYCTFCDLMLDPEPNRENALHIFYECNPVAQTIDELFKRLTDEPDFQFSRSEYFTVFERRDYSFSKNYILTIWAKLAISYVWDCRNSKYIPNIGNC